MNQKQLVTAVRRMWNDHSLDSDRKAYLMQRIMASRYIVAQQQKRGAPAAKALAMPVGVPCRSYHNGSKQTLGCAHYKRRQAALLSQRVCDTLIKRRGLPAFPDFVEDISLSGAGLCWHVPWLHHRQFLRLRVTVHTWES